MKVEFRLGGWMRHSQELRLPFILLMIGSLVACSAENALHNQASVPDEIHPKASSGKLSEKSTDSVTFAEGTSELID